MKKIITIINIFITAIILLSTNVFANNTSMQDEIDWNIIGNAVENTIENYEKAIEEEKKKILESDAIINCIFITSGLKDTLNLDNSSVQIGDKLYLEYSNEEKNDIYKYMTKNAQKIFEKNTNYFKKGNCNYYDTGRLRTIPFLYETDTYTSDEKLVSSTENKVTFNVVIKNKDTNKVIKTYKEGLKLVYKEATDEWLIDSLKFKDKVEKDDTYPEYPVIEEKVKEEKDTSNKKDNTTKVEENKNTTNIVKEEINNNTVVSNNTVLEATNVINNIDSTLQNSINQVLETDIMNNDNEELKVNNLLVILICCIVVVIITLIIVACKKVKNKSNKE